MTRLFISLRLLAAACITTLLVEVPVEAAAKSARCYTSDDGHYNCRFTGTDNLGSFRISAPGKPTYMLNIDKPGVAYGFADFGTGRNVSLPGYYVRQRQDPACWSNTSTNTTICAW